MPSIRAAINARKRPTAFIMGDDWFGHRDPITHAKVGDREEYTRWDFALHNAFQTIEDYTDQHSGLPAWELADDEAYVNANRKTNKFLAARDVKTKGTDKKPYKPIPGEYFVPDLKSHRRDEHGNPVFQTFREYITKGLENEHD